MRHHSLAKSVATASSCLRLLPVFLLAVSAGCATSNIPALTSADARFGQSEEEQKLLARANALDQELDRKGMLLETPALVDYLQSVGQPLVPHEAARLVGFRFHVLRSPVSNAFALPNGSIYLSVGLLAHLDNETELAQVIGHEISHVVLRHGIKSYESKRSGIITAHIADMFLFGTSIAYLPYIASVASFSREQEEEADVAGLRSVAAQGYSPDEAIQVFERIQEVKSGEAVKGSWYSSHPSNNQRAEALRERVRKGEIPAGQPREVGTAYRALAALIAEENIRLKLNARQYELALDAATRSLTEHPDSALYHFYQGEAYRSMGDDPKGAAREHSWISGKSYNDALVAEFEGRRNAFYQSAEKAYQQALSLDKHMLVALRGLGLVNLGRGEYDAARERLGTYLAQNKTVSDRGYINNLLKGINQ